MENFFDQPVKSNMRTYHNSGQIATAQGHYYTTGSWIVIVSIITIK